MAINKKLIHFKTKQKFNEELANGNILETSIVFIQDSKEIYTHGQYYGDLSECLTKYPQEFTKEEKEQMLENLGYYAVEWDGSSETIELSDEEYRKVLSATNVYLVLMDTIYLLPTIKTNEIYVYNFIQENIISIFLLDTSTNPMALTDLSVLIPRTTSELGNDSNFISSDNLKTINGESILGEGDIIIPTKVSELVNDANYIQDDVISDGVYAVNANGKLIDYNTADATALGVALVAGEHKFMIAKSDATNDGSNYNLYYDYDKGDLSLTNYSNADGTNSYGYLGTELSTDFATWTAGALSDFNGKSNTQVIAASSSNAKDMCKVLETFNAGSDNQGHSDWYVPAAGQLALMYLAKTDINAALTNIGGTALESDYYQSSSEYHANNAWGVLFRNGFVNNYLKNFDSRVRFVRDISVKSLKERVSDLESQLGDINTILESIING